MKKYLLLMSMLVVASSIYAENSARLDETVVSATGFETTVKDEVKNITVITKEDIERKNYSTVEEILKDSPFVQTVNTSYGVRFDMRGQGERASSRVKILVDGIPVNMMNMLYGTECAFPVNNIPVDQIQKIEIVPGGGGVLYGSGTSGGFINIVTATKLGNYAKVGATYGSYDNKKMDVVTGVQVTDKLFADINYTGRNDYLRATNAAIQALKLAFEKESISVAYNVMTLDFGVKGGVNLHDKPISFIDKTNKNNENVQL